MGTSVVGSSPWHPATCDGCAQPIWFALTTANHVLMPLNAKTDPAGNIAVHKDGTGTWWARTLRKGQEPDPRIEKRYTPHFATCTRASEFRKQVARAQATRARQQRNQRGRHAATPVVPAADGPGQLRLFPGA
jgi:hypothetical protein